MVESTKKTTRTKKTADNKAGLSISVFGIDGKETKTVELSKDIFGVEPNADVLAQYIRVYLANQRQGNASTKDRGEVTGSSKKIFRQKGTGRARHGNIRAPIFVGGGVVGGPRPHDYTLKINKKQRRQALMTALTMKVEEHNIVAFDKSLVSMKPETKKVAQLMKTLGLVNTKVVVVAANVKENGLALSVRNLPKVEVISATTLNPYNIVSSKKVIFLEDALDVLSAHYSKNNEK